MAWVALATGSPVEVVSGKKSEPPDVVETGRSTTPSAVTAATANTTATTTVTSANDAGSGEPKNVSILKQINKVNEDGSYTFGYEASDGSFKVETRDVAGNVKGMFGFVDETGRLKRVSYSASNSSGFQSAAGSGPSPPVQEGPARRRKQQEERDEPAGGVKKVLVSKRPVTAGSARFPDEDRETEDRGRGGNDLRRQLSKNVDGDAPDVYGVHGRSSMMMQPAGPVSPVVSALMSELDPIGPPLYYRDNPVAFDRRGDTAVVSDRSPNRVLVQEDDDDDDDGQPPLQTYRQAVPRTQYRPPAVAYQLQQPVAPMYRHQAAAYGPDLVALRDELMELILSFVQTRVSQLIVPVTSPYPRQYQPMSYPLQPNYYVPSYYQGPRMPAVQHQRLTDNQQSQQQDNYYVTAATQQQQQQQSSPRITQTLKDGLIRMLLSTSPRYDPAERIDERLSPTYYRSTTQSTPVRNVQIIDDGGGIGAGSRSLTTVSPD